jgi:hypothetical protein
MLNTMICQFDLGRHRCWFETRQPAARVYPVRVPLVRPFRRAENCTRPRARLPANGQHRKPQDWFAPRRPRDRTAQNSTPPSLPLHSGSQVSSRRRIDWCHQSVVGFFAKPARNQMMAPLAPLTIFAPDCQCHRPFLPCHRARPKAGRKNPRCVCRDNNKGRG